jgi:hypothetical protein
MATQIYMGTTKIEADKTAAELMTILARSGARQVAMEYSAAGQIEGLRFVIPVGGEDRCFALPARVDPIIKFVRNDRAQARRTAWRLLLRWCEAQLALIQVGMVKAEEVYTPYMVMPTGLTLYAQLCATQFKMLAAPATELPMGRSG